MGVIKLPSTTIGVIILLLGIMKFKRNLPFNNILKALAFCIFLNFISCQIFREQSIVDTFRSSNAFFSLALFWLFYSWRIDLKKWENMLWCLCLFFGICYIIQYIAFPTIIFGGQIRTGSNEERMAIVGQGLASLSFLFGLNKFFVTKNNKYIIIMLTGLFAVFGCGYRSMLLALIISSSILLIRLGIDFKRIIYFLFLSAIVFLFITKVQFIGEQLFNMMNRNESLKDNGWENDIRYINIIYHYSEYFKSHIEMFLGSGMPFPDSAYGKYSNDILVEKYHFYYSDWGLIGLSWMIGIPAVVIMIYYSIKMFLTKVPNEYLYIGIYFFNITISSITSHEFYIHENFVVQAILFCIFSKVITYNNIYTSRIGKWKTIHTSSRIKSDMVCLPNKYIIE